MSGKEDKDSFLNPALFSGLKFYESLEKRKNAITAFALAKDIASWHHSLGDYYAFTKAFMAPSAREKIEAELIKQGNKIRNYHAFVGRLGNSGISIHLSIRDALLVLQGDIMDATSHLNLKASSGDNGKFDVREVFNT